MEPSQGTGSLSIEPKLVRGVQVEVMRRLYEGAREEVWYPATIIETLWDERYLVEYLTIPSQRKKFSPYTEEVGLQNIRPIPPFVHLGKLGGLDQVDGWYNGGWWVGFVSCFVPGRKYWISLRGTGEEMPFDHYKLRRHQDIDCNGNWNPAPKISPYDPEASTGPYELEKIKGREVEETFTVGMMVEVRTNDGSLFPAKIVNRVGDSKYRVQYPKQNTDRTQPRKEVIAGTLLRPRPPKPEKIEYNMLDEVDAFDDFGWLPGLIIRTIGAKYVVYSWTTNEKVHCGGDRLRHHQNWNFGKWTAAPAPKMHNLSKMPKWDITVGKTVEVRIEAHGFVGVPSGTAAWYSAEILGCLALSKYIVVYQNLRKKDGSGSLQHIVEGYQIRPRPPRLVDKRGGYALLELVDARYYEGWRVGLISRILDTSEYTLYFWNSNEEMEFHPSALRPHQDWTDGKWKIPLKMSNSLMKSKLGKLGQWEGQPASGAYFSNGKSVEICSKEKGFHDAWYPAVIIRPMGDGKYLVRHLTVTDDDETQLLVQEAYGSCIRPTPPPFLQDDPFKALEQVDAWYREGWFVGHIQKVTADSNYLVHLNTTGEVVEFQYEYLRSHQDWLNAEWKSSTKGRMLLKEN